MGKIFPFRKWFRRRSPEPAERTQLDWKRSRQTGAPGRSFRLSRLPRVGFYLLSAVIVAGVLALGPWSSTGTFDWLPRFVSGQPEVKLPKVVGGRSAPNPVIEIIDGDTVRSGGSVYRLVGFDTPEAGMNAGCESERALAVKATQRLRQLVARGANLRRVSCACRPGTEGTRACNSGRLCGVLTIGGQDVAATMIREGLARAYRCSGTSCPPRGSWC